MAVALALAPIGLLLALLLGLRWSAGAAGAVAAALAAGIAVLGMGYGDGAVVPALAGPALEAAFQSATILWIIFPALCIHELQSQSGGTAVFGRALAGISHDPRIGALLIAWFFALFLEGAAGFGTPIALAAPLLVAVGFAPVKALLLALVGNAAAVPFGAIGTPMAPLIDATGLDPNALSLAIVLLNASAGWTMAAAVSRLAAGPGMPTREGAATGGIVAAALFFAPAALLAWATGPELPSIGGALAGGLLFVLLVRRRGTAATPGGDARLSPPPELLRAAVPYLLVIILILATRLIGPLEDRLREVEIGWSLAGGFGGSIQPLHHPGTMLLLAFLAAGAGRSDTRERLPRLAIAALARLPRVAVALVAVLTLARLMVHSGMIDLLAATAAATFGGGWPLVAPLLGALGAFVTGSGTASNILFGGFQAGAAACAGVSPLVVAAAQAVGAAAGNLIAPHNVVAGAATIGLVGREGEIMRRALPLALLYAGLAGLAAILASVMLRS